MIKIHPAIDIDHLWPADIPGWNVCTVQNCFLKKDWNREEL